MQALTSQEFTRRALPDPVGTPLSPADANLAIVTDVHPSKIREAVVKNLIPPTCYITNDSGRRTYLNVELRKRFGMPLEGDITLAGPLF